MKPIKSIQYITIPVCFAALMWIIKVAEYSLHMNLSSWGIYPRTLKGLTGILSAPLLHGSFQHLYSNTFPLIILSSGILYFYKKSAPYVILIIYLVTHLLVWLFARQAYHIGSSGLIYGFVTFLFFSGVIRRDKRSISLALLVTFLYGSLVWGILPLRNGFSWESHLFGSLTGILCAIIFRKSDPYKRYDWEDEPSTDPSQLKVSRNPSDDY